MLLLLIVFVPENHLSVVLLLQCRQCHGLLQAPTLFVLEIDCLRGSEDIFMKIFQDAE